MENLRKTIGKPMENGGLMVCEWDLPSGHDCYIANWKITIEIVSFPIENGDLTHSYVTKYQRLNG